jgi:hypothetical protein
MKTPCVARHHSKAAAADHAARPDFDVIVIRLASARDTIQAVGRVRRLRHA